MSIIGTAAILNLIPVVVKVISKHYGNKVKDELLQSRNDRYNRLVDNYNEGISAQKVDKSIIDKYRKELHALYEETLRLTKARKSDKQDDSDLYITINQDKDNRFKTANRTKVDKDSILEQYINPFLVVLRMVLVRPVHILAGTTMGADRRDFELVFDPDKTNVEDVQRDAFRTVIYKYKWPSHGFEVTTRGQADANKFIDETIEFLANNPKFLAIRVK
jgi:hypothetical protein